MDEIIPETTRPHAIRKYRYEEPVDLYKLPPHERGLTIECMQLRREYQQAERHGRV